MVLWPQISRFLIDLKLQLQHIEITNVRRPVSCILHSLTNILRILRTVMGNILATHQNRCQYHYLAISENIQMFLPHWHVLSQRVTNSLNVIIGIMDEEHCIVYSESFESDLNLDIQYMTDLTRTSVTNNWIVYRTEGTVVVKKACQPINAPQCGWAAKTKRA